MARMAIGSSVSIGAHTPASPQPGQRVGSTGNESGWASSARISRVSTSNGASPVDAAMVAAWRCMSTASYPTAIRWPQ